MPDLEVAAGVVLPEEACSFQAVRSSGPGGQNVNKVATKIMLRVEVDRIVGLSAAARVRLQELAGRRWAEGGILWISASEARSQHENRKLAKAKLLALLRHALEVPKLRRKSRPTRSSIQREVVSQQARSRIKRARRPIRDEE